MEDREMKEFSWSIFFCVTAISFVIFSAALKFLDAPHSGLFIRAGIAFGVLGILSILNNWLGKKFMADKSPVSSQQQELF